jgi:hypothetical protein
MNVCGWMARASLIVCALGGCASHSAEEEEETREEEGPLDVTVDSLDVVHGRLRIVATMVDGAADVSVRLGGECEHRDVGGGLSTLSTFVWALGDGDVGDAIVCGLVVRARVRDGARYVNKVAELAVAVGAATTDPDSQEGPQLQDATTTEAGVLLAFANVRRSARLTTGDSILAPEEADPQTQHSAAVDGVRRFMVPRADFARSVLEGRPLVVDGASFETGLSVGNTPLEADPPQPDARDGREGRRPWGVTLSCGS